MIDGEVLYRKATFLSYNTYIYSLKIIIAKKQPKSAKKYTNIVYSGVEDQES
jgi:hypothetical protein